MNEALAPGTRLGPYEIEGLIGAGGMGQVYRARDPRLGRLVAVKTLAGVGASDPDLVRRFETEARAAGTLDHPGLLVVYDVGREGTVSYIVSELLDGETLRHRLRQGGVPVRQAIDYTMQIASGLAAAHERGIVHRDLKPENLFLTRTGRVKILDFGVAKLTRPEETADTPTAIADTVTSDGVMVGTVGYMAPEQVRAEPIDHRADIFALGLVIHEMLSGGRTFKRDTMPETLTAILNDDPGELPAAVPNAVARVVGRCLEKRRDDRFHSAHDIGLALELLTTPGGTSVTPAPTPAPGVPRRRALVTLASSVALLASGLAGGVWLAGRRGSPAAPSFRRLTFRRGLIRSARVAPDGQTILYGALWEGSPCRVHTGRLDSPESYPLDLQDANVLAISRTGEVALALGAQRNGVVTYGTLAQVPITGGVPRELVEDVKFADWSPDGAGMAIIRRVDGRDRLEFPIGKVLVQPGVGENTGLGFARFSPDGTRVAFVQYRSPGSLLGRVCVTDRSGRVTVLSEESLNTHGLAWKGEEIWHTASDDRPLFRALRAVSVNGAHRTITRMPGNATLWDVLPDGRLLIAHTDDRAVLIARRPDDVSDRDLSWLDASRAEDISRDGRWLLLTETGQGGGPTSSAYRRGMDGSAPVRLRDGRSLALSPDGRWAVCISGNNPSPYLELVPTGAGDVKRLPDHGLGYTGARWLPDGQRLIVSASEAGRRTRLYVLSTAQGQPTAVTPEGIGSWVVSPEGGMIAATGPGAGMHLYPVDGGERQDVKGLTGNEEPVGWINDGLLVMRPDDPTALGEVYKIDTRSGRVESWRNVLPRDPAGVMVFVSFQVTPDGKSQAYTWHRALSSLYVAEGLS